MYLMKEECVQEMVATLEKLARGRVTCKAVQRAAFDCLNAVRKAHPELLNDDTTADIAGQLIQSEVRPCKQE